MIDRRWKNYILFLFIMIGLLLLSACSKDTMVHGSEEVIRIDKDYFISDSGILYLDGQQYQLKSYFDYETKQSVYFCTKANCNHTTDYCMAKVARKFNFILDDHQYYIIEKAEMDKEGNELLISYLYKSDLSDSNASLVARIDGISLQEIYLVGDVLYLLILKPKIVDGVSTDYSTYHIYQINLKNLKVKTTFVKEGKSIGYLNYGFSDYKLLIYYRYSEWEVDPADYGSNGNFSEFMQDEVNYQRYIKEVLEAFRDGMCYYDLRNEKIVNLDLPTRVYVTDDCYYYNQVLESGGYQFMEYNFITDETRMIYNGPIYHAMSVGDWLFLQEGIEGISPLDNTTPIITYDRAVCQEWGYNLATGERIELMQDPSETGEFQLLKEYNDYYIFFYSNIDKNIYRRIGYILKDDYFNQKSNYTLVSPR